MCCPFALSESERLQKAFLAACQHGTCPSYRARINIIGHSGAGKTSLTRRLLGQKFQDNEQSTDGIETHRIEFDLKKSPLDPVVWSEAEMSTEQLSGQFNAAVLQQKENLAQTSREDIEVVYSRVQESSTGAASPVQHSETETKEKVAGASDSDFTKSHTIPPVRTGITEKLKAYSAQMWPEEDFLDVSKGVLQLWDFGGQTEFYTTHHMFLDAGAINIIVMDISKAMGSKLDSEKDELTLGVPSTPEEFLCYWLRSIEANAKEKKTELTTLIILTHKDLIPSALTDDHIATFKKHICDTIEKNNLTSVPPENFFVVDNKGGSEGSFNDLRYQFSKSLKQQSTWGEERPVRWLKLEADMKEVVNEKTQKPLKYLKFGEIRDISQDYGMQSAELEACLGYLHSKGDIVWFPDTWLRDVIILDPQWLVDVFKVLITPAIFMGKKATWEEKAQLYSSGIVSFSSLEKFWAGNDARFLVEMLQKFDLILPIGKGEGKSRKFCVPCMLPEKKGHSTDHLLL